MKRYGWLLMAVILAAGPGGVVAKSKKKTAAKKVLPAKNKAKHGKLKTKLNSVRSKIEDVRDDLHEQKLEKNEVADRLEAIENELNRSQSSLKRTRERLGSAKDRQQVLAVRLEQTEEKLDSRKGLLAKRLRAAFVLGDAEKISVLLGSGSISELLSRSDTLERISAEDHKLYSEVKAMKEQAAADKKAQDETVQEIAGLEQSQKEETASLHRATQEKRALLREIKNNIAILGAQEDELVAQSAQIERDIQSLYQSPIYQARAKTRAVYRGGLRLPGARVTSGFGYRVHPIAKTRRLHTGVDYGMGMGTPIAAAGDGEVIAAGYRRGYGNTVIIDHGGGISTLYGHCSSLSVSVGQEVKQGQTVGRVGSTGYSTGPHLHFEIRVNGSPVNPLSY